jgi:hypothetical protein
MFEEKGAEPVPSGDWCVKVYPREGIMVERAHSKEGDLPES